MDQDHPNAAGKIDTGCVGNDSKNDQKGRSSSLGEPPPLQPSIPFKKEILDNEDASREAPIGAHLAAVIKKEVVDHASSNSNAPPDLDQDGGESEQRSSSSPSSSSFPALSRPPDAPLLP